MGSPNALHNTSLNFFEIKADMQFPAALFVAPINHLLRAAPWALEKLKPYAGKTAAFEVFPLTYRYTV